MKNKLLLLALGAMALAFSFSCKKEAPNIFTMFKDVTLELDSTSNKFNVGQYTQLNDGDSFYIDFTIKSAVKDMYQVAVFKMGSAIPFLRIPVENASDRRSFSDIVRLKASEGVGTHTYRIWAYDQDGVYIGDGYKTITIDVQNNYVHLPFRRVYFPDDVSTSLASYLDITGGKAYGYADGAANSANIDLGVYRNSSGANFLYSLSANPLPYTPFDISSWTKKGTLFANPHNNQQNTFNRNLHSGSAIESYAKGRNPNRTSLSSAFALNSVIAFKTPEGKYGALLVTGVNNDYSGNPYVEFSIKYQQ